MIPQGWNIVVIDLKDYFFTIPLHPHDTHSFAFTMPSMNREAPKKRYEWVIFLQGMRNSLTMCQLYIDWVLQPVRQHFSNAMIYHYMDDILIATRQSFAEADLNWLISQLKCHGLTVAPEKIQRSAPWKYLGCLITDAQIRPQKIILHDNISTLHDAQKLFGDLQWVRTIVGITNDDLQPFLPWLHGSDANSPQICTLAQQDALVKQKKKGETQSGWKFDSAAILLKWVFLPVQPKCHVMSRTDAFAALIRKGRDRIVETDGKEPADISVPMKDEDLEWLLRHSVALQETLLGFAVMGVLVEIKTNNGPAYVSQRIARFMQKWGVKHTTGIPHSSTGQAIVERTNCTLKEYLAKQKQNDDIDVVNFMGVLVEIKTNNGPAYVSQRIARFMQKWGVKHTTGIPHSSTGQAIVERTNCTLKEYLAKQKQNDDIDVVNFLGINLIVKESQLVVSLYKLTTEDEGKIDSNVWHAPEEAGRLEIEPIRIEIERPEEPIRVKQYPILMEGRRGLKPVIDDLVKRGTLEPCMSRHNTSILAVRKTDGSYRLVQDLRAVNERTRTKFPVVANPYTLLNRVSLEDTWYSVIDLKDAFWTCPQQTKDEIILLSNGRILGQTENNNLCGHLCYPTPLEGQHIATWVRTLTEDGRQQLGETWKALYYLTPIAYIHFVQRAKIGPKRLQPPDSIGQYDHQSSSLSENKNAKHTDKF
ncbi:hypothetical protein HGM15179_017704 [Zosterops borbonicus]|uniref:ribonuclease H n=1 Tax=Zosterops borbonicus TaxID=364589 RepID=A0A8K1G0E2_9PASS|nr:hypothetical protein HGM15179_017704 [Zosterops borbonicus]